MFLVCRHIKPNGLRCQSPAFRRGSFCYFHARLYNRTTGEGAAINRLDLPDMRDPDAIHAALRKTLHAYCSSRLDRKSAGLLLYALQIAAQNVNRRSTPPNKKPAPPVAPSKKSKSPSSAGD